MTTEIQISSKEPSQALMMIITNCASDFIATGSSLEEVIENGKLEGYSEQQLKTLVAIEIHRQLKGQGLDEKQIKNRLHYILNANTIKEKRNKRYLEQKKSSNNRLEQKSSSNNKDVLNCSVRNDLESWDKDSALEEIARLRTELNEAHGIIENITFSDNPNIVTVRRDSENFFAKVTAREVGSIVAGVVDDLGRNVNFWFEEVEQ